MNSCRFALRTSNTSSAKAFPSDINHQNTTTQGGGQEKKKENGKVAGIIFK